MKRDKGKAKIQKRQAPVSVGVLLSWFEDTYQADIWRGISELAQEQDVNLIGFVGGVLRSPHEFDLAGGFEAQRNVVYDLASLESLNGLIVLTSALSSFITSEEMRQFCDRYNPMPMVGVAQALEGIPSVLVDNRQGMREAVMHLIRTHDHRRIVFVRGPEGHVESEERYLGYTDALAECELELDPNLILLGNFNVLTTEAAILQLLQKQGQIEAVAAANDLMALQVIKTLQAYGLRVPEDVAVVGFDGVAESRRSTPTLTTAQQPLHEMGRQAAELLLSRLAGKPIPAQTTLPVSLALRQSCGCLPQTKRTTIRSAAAADDTLDAFLQNRRETVLSEMTLAALAHSEWVDPNWAESLLDGFVADLKGKPKGAMIAALQDVLRQVIANGEDASAWQEAISALRYRILPHLKDKSRTLAEDLFHGARLEIEDTARQTRLVQEAQSGRQMQLMLAASHMLAAALDVKQLQEAVVWGVSQLDIRRCCLSLYDGKGTPSEWSKLLVACVDGQQVELEQDQGRFRSRRLVPESLLPTDGRYTLIVKPLYVRTEQYGFITFSLGPEGWLSHEVLRGLISGTLRGALLLQQNEELVKKAQSALADAEATHRRYLRQGWQSFLGGRTAGPRGYQDNPAGLISTDEILAPEVEQAITAQNLVIQIEEADAETQQPARTALAIPILLRGQTIGVLDFYDEGEKRIWTQEELSLVRALADQVALALENARLLEEAQGRAARERLLSDVTGRMRETLEVDTVLQTAIRELGQALEVAEVEVRLGTGTAPTDERVA